jgi:hypothetical protein
VRCRHASCCLSNAKLSLIFLSQCDVNFSGRVYGYFGGGCIRISIYAAADKCKGLNSGRNRLFLLLLIPHEGLSVSEDNSCALYIHL